MYVCTSCVRVGISKENHKSFDVSVALFVKPFVVLFLFCVVALGCVVVCLCVGLCWVVLCLWFCC